MPDPELDELRALYGEYLPGPRFPKAVADGVYWLGGCSAIALDETVPDLRHSQCNCYLVVGEDKTLLVDAGHPALWHGLRPALHEALAGRPLDYVMPTHAEIPHAGALTLLHREWPELRVVGNTQDYHLFHPELPDSAYLPMRRGQRQSIDLGGRRFDVLAALFKDLGSTVWGFDHGTRTLFPADAFACMHWHSKEHCGLTLEEIGPDPEPSNVHFIVSGAQCRNLDRKLHEFDVLVTELDVRILAPAHGTVITDPRRARWFLDGLRQVSAGV